MSHLVLLGDSIFDNAVYVARGQSVLEHLGRALPGGWRATMLARDGAVTSGVPGQAEGVQADATHVAVSVGGNDALGQRYVVLHERAGSLAEAMGRLADIRERFAVDYRRMLGDVLALRKRTLVCTIYDAIPSLQELERAALSLFNDVILREAFRAGVDVLDLRLVCAERGDYAPSSPIEPSAEGGRKIARALAQAVSGEPRCRLFA